MLVPDCPRLVPTHLARRDAARILEALQPVDRRADAYPEPGRRLIPRQALLFDRCNHSLSKVHRVWFCHPCWPPHSSQHVESDLPRKGNPLSIQSKTIPLWGAAASVAVVPAPGPPTSRPDSSAATPPATAACAACASALRE